MSDRVKLARDIAARTKPRFSDTNPKRPQTLEDCNALARKMAAAKPPRFITIPTRTPRQGTIHRGTARGHARRADG